MIIFNNGSGSQTDDLTIPTDGKNMYDYDAGEWTTYVPGGSGEDTTYTVTIAETTNGTVTADKATAAEGEIVTLTITFADGYVLDNLTIMDANGNHIMPANDNTFEMPASDVTVTATFRMYGTDLETVYLRVFMPCVIMPLYFPPRSVCRPCERWLSPPSLSRRYSEYAQRIHSRRCCFAHIHRLTVGSIHHRHDDPEWYKRQHAENRKADHGHFSLSHCSPPPF